MNSYVLPRQSGKTLAGLFNQILQNKLDGIPLPTHDTLFEENHSRFIRDNLYIESETTFYRDRSYGDLPLDMTSIFETSGKPITDIMQSWLTGITDPFSKFFT